MKRIVIIGAGDGGRIISELAKQQGFKILGFIDDNKKLQKKLVNGYKVIGTSNDLRKFPGMGFVVVIGTDMQARNRLFETALRARLKPVNIIHQSVIVDKTAKIGQGVIISVGCIIGSFTEVKDNVLLFAGTILEHDCHIGKNVCCSARVSMGRVSVGENTFLGINSCVLPGVVIGKNVIVGAGSVVLKDIPDNTVVAGVPARIIRKNNG